MLASKTRRKFITEAGLSSIGLLLLHSLGISSCNRNQGARIHTAIIGAGLAGLRCASLLRDAGVPFMVFEADMRNGGRIFTDYHNSLDNNTHPEFGGEFIDSNHTDMIELIQKYQLSITDLNPESIKDTTHYYIKKNQISQSEIEKQIQLISSKLLSDRQLSGKLWDTDFALQLDQISLQQYIDTLPCSDWMKDILSIYCESEFGLDCSLQSSLNLLSLINNQSIKTLLNYHDRKFKITEGTSSLIQKLENHVGTENIKQDFKLSELFDGENGKYVVVFQNGMRYTADNVVLTIPYTSLRNVKLDLRELDTKKKECITQLSYGQQSKLLLPYHNLKNISQNATNTQFTVSNIIPLAWSVQDNKSDAINYNSLLSGSKANQLRKFSIPSENSNSKGWLSKLPTDVIELYTNEINAIYSESKNAWTGKQLLVDWNQNPFFMGSNHCYSIGQRTSWYNNVGAATGQIYFAGEHCSHHFPRTMNGAAESGRRIATILIEQFFKTND